MLSDCSPYNGIDKETRPEEGCSSYHSNTYQLSERWRPRMITNINCTQTLLRFSCAFYVLSSTRGPGRCLSRGRHLPPTADLFDVWDSHDVKRPPHIHHGARTPTQHINVESLKGRKKAKCKHYLWLLVKSWQIPFYNLLQTEIWIFFQSSSKNQKWWI